VTYSVELFFGVETCISVNKIMEDENIFHTTKMFFVIEEDFEMRPTSKVKNISRVLLVESDFIDLFGYTLNPSFEGSFP